MKPLKILPSQGESKINRNHLKKPPMKKNGNLEMKEREGGFMLNGNVINSKLNYDPTNDEHLKQFFVNQRVKSHLNKINKILNKSNHLSDDDTRTKEDSSRGLLNNKKDSQTALSSSKTKSDSETKDFKKQKNLNFYGTTENENIRKQDTEITYKSKDDQKQLKEKDSYQQNFQQLELPKIQINSSNVYNSNTLNNSTLNNISSTKDNSTINGNNSNSSFVNQSQNNTSSTAFDQLNSNGNKEGGRKSELKSYIGSKINNQYQTSGLRNKIILRPLVNIDKLDKDTTEIKKVYGSVQQEDSYENYKLAQKRHSQNVLNSSALSSYTAEQENLSYSDYRVNPLSKYDPKKRTRSITGKKSTLNETILSTIDLPSQSTNISMYEGSSNQQKKYGVMYNSTNIKGKAREQNQGFLKNLQSEIENLEKINESKGILPVSKVQFSSFIDQFKQKYNSSAALPTQNGPTSQNTLDQQDTIQSRKNEIEQLKKEKKEIIKRQEMELQDLEQKILQYEIQQKQLKQDIFILDREKDRLYQNQDESSYYMNKIVIPSPKDNDNYVIHEQVQDEETYRSPPKKQKIKYTEEIEEDIDEMLYTKPIQDGKDRKKWFSNEKNQKIEGSVREKTPEIKEDVKNQEIQKTDKKQSKSNKKNKENFQKCGYETDELQNKQTQYLEATTTTTKEKSSKKQKTPSYSLLDEDNEKENLNKKKSGVIDEYLLTKSQFRMTSSQMNKTQTQMNMTNSQVSMNQSQQNNEENSPQKVRSSINKMNMTESQNKNEDTVTPKKQKSQIKEQSSNNRNEQISSKKTQQQSTSSMNQINTLIDNHNLAQNQEDSYQKQTEQQNQMSVTKSQQQNSSQKTKQSLNSSIISQNKINDKQNESSSNNNNRINSKIDEDDNNQQKKQQQKEQEQSEYDDDSYEYE